MVESLFLQVTAHRCPRNSSHFLYVSFATFCVFEVILPFTEKTIFSYFKLQLFFLIPTRVLQTNDCNSFQVSTSFFSLQFHSNPVLLLLYKNNPTFHITILKVLHEKVIQVCNAYTSIPLPVQCRHSLTRGSNQRVTRTKDRPPRMDAAVWD